MRMLPSNAEAGFAWLENGRKPKKIAGVLRYESVVVSRKGTDLWCYTQINERD
jgi:hypothetical protein